VSRFVAVAPDKLMSSKKSIVYGWSSVQGNTWTCSDATRRATGMGRAYTTTFVDGAKFSRLFVETVASNIQIRASQVISAASLARQDMRYITGILDSW